MDLVKEVKKFKKKYPLTVAWRLKINTSIIEKHLNPDEEVKYIFAGQKNDSFYDFFSTGVIALTNQRILIGRKRVLFGYALDSVMPYMYNDLNIRAGLIWGKVIIDTIKEKVILTNIDSNALAEIDDNITMHMLEEKNKLKKEEN